MPVVRFAKIVLVAAIAAFAFVVAYDNVVDYDSNYEFVRHVLSLDTTFPHNALMHRAITDPRLWAAAYIVIIALEAVTSLLLIVGALALLALINAPPAVFNRAKVWAVAGLTVGFTLWFSAFWSLPASILPCGNRRRGMGRKRPFGSQLCCSAS